MVRAVRTHLEELEASGGWGAPVSPPSTTATEAGASPPSPPQERVRAPAVVGAATSRASLTVERAGAPRAQATAATGTSERASAALGPAAMAIPRGPLGSEAARARLTVLEEETRACTRCGLHQGRSQSVFSRGTGSSGLVFVGEGPGEEEDRQGFPFVGPAGQLLDRMIAAMELGRDEVYVCNIVKCRPPKNRKPEPDEMATCMPFLAEQLALIEPRVIVALGATAVQGLLGTTEGITRIRGQWKLYRGQIPVMPTFHPAYLLRTPTAKREVWKDLQDVLRRMRGSEPAP